MISMVDTLTYTRELIGVDMATALLSDMPLNRHLQQTRVDQYAQAEGLLRILSRHGYPGYSLRHC